MYANGQGIIQDYIQSHMWFQISNSLGNRGAKKNIDFIENQMTSAQIAEAQRLARECVKKNYKGC